MLSTSAQLLFAVLTLASTCTLSAQKNHADALQDLRQSFVNPPNEAKPMVRWWWFGVAVTKPEILRELQQMKGDGIGGAELAFVYPEVLDDPSRGLKNLSFLGPEMLDAVSYAQTEARKLGLRIDVTLCSGWPYGGPATTLAEAATRLMTVEVPLAAGQSSVPNPPLKQGDSIIAASLVKGVPHKWESASAQPLKPGVAGVSVAAGSGPRTVLFFVQSHTRQQVKRAAVGAEGWVLDPFSREAVATHLKAVGEPLVKAFGATPPYAIFSDSLEAYGADWTPNLPAEFQKRRGYDLIPHLPELAAGGSPAAAKVRHDYGRTLTELVDENYLTQINDWANAHHTKFRSQTYGEPAVSLSSQRLVALPEGEGPQWRAFSTLRWATSANHVFGNNVTSGESFTWLHSPVFRATPLDMKAEADIDFLMGENQLVFHGWPYSAPQVGEPGWSLYAAAVFNDHNPWHPVMPAVTAYISRISYLLRQGEPANQVAILLPTDDAWAGFSPGKVTVSGAMQKLVSPALMGAILSAGYNVDYIDADAINKVGLGTHTIVVLPPTDRIPVETLRKLAAYSDAGGKVIAVGRLPSMDAGGAGIPEIAKLTNSIVLVRDATQLPEALQHATVPDFQLKTTDDSVREQVGFIRRKLPNADIYFVANTSNRSIEATAIFASKNNLGFELDTEADSFYGKPAYPKQEIKLAPYESRVFVFDHSGLSEIEMTPMAEHPLQDLSTDWKVSFPAVQRSFDEHKLTDWTADPATLHYSGEAVYSRDFTVVPAPRSATFLEVSGGQALPGAPNSPAEHAPLGKDGLPDPRVTRPGPGMHAYYEPPIREAALVVVNGKPAGALWHPPYRLDITQLLKAGENHIEIHVYNTALNAWSALPPQDYKPLIAKYGDRFQVQDLDKVKPVSSGLFGTIHLVTQDAQK